MPRVEQAQRRVVGLCLGERLLLPDGRLQPELEALAPRENSLPELLLVGFDVVGMDVAVFLDVGGARFRVGHVGVEEKKPLPVFLSGVGNAHVRFPGVLYQLGIHALFQAFQGSVDLEKGRGFRFFDDVIF